jgi:ketosteroid isomerase-like protein
MIGTLFAKTKIHQAFRALNEKDLEAFLANWSEDVVFHYPGNLTVSGTFSGKDAVRKWFISFFDRMQRIKFTVHHVCAENMFDMFGNNTIAAQWTIRVRSAEGIETENMGINLIKIKWGRVVEVRDFFFYPERGYIAWAESPQGKTSITA